MIIHKILNNNVIVSKNEEGVQSIAMGRGLAFSREVGDVIDKALVDKVFELKGEENLDRFKSLVNEIPLEYFMVADLIIKKAKIVLGKPLNDNLYISLSDHIYGVVERQKKGVTLTNVLNYEIKRFYSDEYAVGLYALKVIKEELGAQLIDDEAGFIALHLFNAQLDDGFHEAMEMTEMIQLILSIVTKFFDIELDEESLHFFRFMTHLKFFSYRVLSGNTYDGENDQELMVLMTRKNPDVYACVLEISSDLLKFYNYKLSTEEKLYLLIHISKVVMGRR